MVELAELAHTGGSCVKKQNRAAACVLSAFSQKHYPGPEIARSKVTVVTTRLQTDTQHGHGPRRRCSVVRVEELVRLI